MWWEKEEKYVKITSVSWYVCMISCKIDYWNKACKKYYIEKTQCETKKLT